ncbi:MAG: hypothetical protein WC718_19240 [Phycisphaerales bacterium]
MARLLTPEEVAALQDEHIWMFDPKRMIIPHALNGRESDVIASLLLAAALLPELVTALVMALEATRDPVSSAWIVRAERFLARVRALTAPEEARNAK